MTANIEVSGTFPSMTGNIEVSGTTFNCLISFQK